MSNVQERNIKAKQSHIDAVRRWEAKQPAEYKDYIRTIVRKSVAKHYDTNRDKILAYKKRFNSNKREIQSLMNLYAIYE